MATTFRPERTGFRPGDGPDSWSAVWAAALAIVVILAGCFPAPAQSSPLEQWDHEVLSAAVGRLEQRLKEVRAAVDQTRFQPDELVFELDFDGAAIVAFANTGIEFHPYRGLLRGVAGTLESRAGNSLDQSVLLAYLLKTAGLDARVVRGELTDEQSRRLLERTRQPKRGDSLDQLQAAIVDIFGKEAVVSAEPVDLAQAVFRRRAETAAARLTEQLHRAGAMPEADTLNDELASNLREYFWVEYRSGPGQTWQAAHPAFRGDPGFEVEPQEYITEKVPARYHHRLTMAAFLRQRVRHEFRTHRLMNDFTRPVANLHGAVLKYHNHPSGLRLGRLRDIEAALSGSQILMPVFGGVRAPGARAFDLKGRTIDPMALSSNAGGAAGVFAELSDDLEQATGILDDPDDPQAVMELDSMWLEFTLEAPGGEKRTQRRYLLPPPGTAERAPEDLIWPSITEYTYVVNAGEMPLDYVADRYLAAGIESLDIFTALAQEMIEPDVDTPLPRKAPTDDFAPLALYQIMNMDPLGPGGAVPVRHWPAVVGLKRGLRDAETAFTAVDIVFNDQLQLRHTGEGVRHDPVTALRRGVWETAVETLPGALRTDKVLSRTNTMVVFDKAREQGIDIRVLSGEDAGSVEDLRMDPVQRSLLESDLEQGYTVVVPTETVEGLEVSAWWRIDPVTGTTLGMTADGHGQDAFEYIIDLTLTSMGLIQAIGGLPKCAREPTNVRQACCLLEAHINNVTGLAFGGVLGASVSASAVAVFEIVNFGLSETTEQSLTPSVNLDCPGLGTPSL